MITIVVEIVAVARVARRADTHRVEYGCTCGNVVFQLFLCLSRACLGPKIDFIHKWLKKRRSSHRQVFLELGVGDRDVGGVAGDEVARAVMLAVDSDAPVDTGVVHGVGDVVLLRE